MMKKIISILLSALFLILCISGCSSDKDNNQKSEADIAQINKITIDSHYSVFDDLTKNSYKSLCEAVINYDAEIKINTSITDDINQLFYTSFPLYSLVSSINYNEEKTGFVISYAFSEKEHKEKINQFFTAINDIRDACGHGKVTKDVFVVNAYKYICESFTPDAAVTSVMECAITKKGANSSLSGLFEYLLLLEDVQASHIIKTEKSGNISMLTLADFCGEKYFFDPFEELNENTSALKYFAMSTKRATDKATLTYTDGVEIEEFESKSFDELANSIGYEVKDNKLIVDFDGGKQKSFKLG